MLRIFTLLLFILSIGTVYAQEITDEDYKKYYKINSEEISNEYYRLIRRNSISELIVTPKPGCKSYFDNLNPIVPLWKLSPALRNNRPESGMFLVQVNDPVKFLSKVERLNIDDILQDERSSTFRLKTDLSVIESLIMDENVVFIDKVDQIRIDEASIRLHDLGLNGISYVQNKYPSLRGEAINVSIKERTVLSNDIDLINRSFVTEFTDSTTSLHATEMATLISGAGNSFKSGRGVADASTITSTNYYSLLPESDSYFRDNQISVQNHSYGVEIANYYGVESQAFDKLLHDNKFLVTVLSAGNSGTEISGEGIYKDIEGYANITGSFKQAKNNILVGAVDTTLSLSERTSRGPAYDGRLKPELVAFGGEGTSEAAALVSGSVILLQENFRLKNNELPTSSLVKACLIAGATDVGARGIDFVSGYGNLNLINALSAIENEHYVEGFIDSNAEDSHAFTIPDGCANARISLTWIDPPANPLDYKALLNDLDLIVEHIATGQRWMPWVLDVTASSENLSAPASRGLDTLNNVELITIDLPIPGEYKIIVKSNSLIDEEQDYSIAYHFEKTEEFRWLTPVEITKLEAAEPYYFRWQSSYQNKNGSLEFSYGDGIWQMLSASIDLSSNYYRYVPKDTISTAMLRMKVLDDTYYSDTFTISPVPKLEVAFDCEDDALLTWQPMAGSTGYNLYRLEDTYQDIILSTVDTEYLVKKEIQPSQYYSLQAQIDQNYDGIRGRTISYGAQSAGCYIEYFNAFINNNNETEVSLILGSDYNVKEVYLDKISSLQVKSSLYFDENSPLNYVYLDEKMDEGINYYQSSIILNDNSKIVSDSIAVVFFEKEQAFVFPNPLASGQGLNIITNSIDPTFQLLDTQGNLVYQTEFSGSSEFIYFDQLRSGIYLYRIIDKDQIIASSRIVIIDTSN